MLTSEMCPDDKQHKKPCATCPFNKKVEPGALGGSTASTYIGQIQAGMWIPCHETLNYADPDWRTDLTAPQCAGAAIFRTAVAAPVAAKQLTLPVSDTVFSSNAEFMAHHWGITLIAARRALEIRTPAELASEELAKATVQRVAVPKD